MSTTIRSNISKKNEYWIEKHRYYELKHFVLQYPIWKHTLQSLDGLSGQSYEYVIRTLDYISDPVAKLAEAREYLHNKIDLVDRTAQLTDEEYGVYILRGILLDKSYDALISKEWVPFSREQYYRMYRRFFWLLDQERD